jgi:NADH-quinone oxidoreductase subunit D
MLLAELNRMSSHLLFLATNGLDLGRRLDDALRLAGARDRPALLPEGHGLRMNHNFIRPGRRGRRPADGLA